MRIALTHNLQRNASEDEAEFDTPATIDALVGAMKALGHEVIPIDVGEGLEPLLERLRTSAPDLIFNTAEGRRGRAREALYPAVFDELGIPYTASDAHVCTVTLDKYLTKRIVGELGVPTPGAALLTSSDLSACDGLAFPLIVKPNYEGSSKGIDEGSVVEDREALRRRLEETLALYPSGMLVEEFVAGRDVTVPWLEASSPETGGVLPAAEYHFDPALLGDLSHRLYDYRLKSELADAVAVRVPADLTEAQREAIVLHTRRVVTGLGIRDVARLDFRVDPQGGLHFIEVNALPSFEPGASLYLSAAQAGLPGAERVVGAVIASALARRGIAAPDPADGARRGRARTVHRPRVGLLYNLKRIDPSSGDDRDAEFDSPTTVHAIARAIEAQDCEVVLLEATAELVRELPAAEIDVGFNIAEGLAGRSREAQVPALLDLLGIAYTGSEPAVLSLTLDKGLAKRVVAQAGVATPEWAAWRRVPKRLPDWVRFPLMVKPLAEGSSKGVEAASVAEDEAGLRELVGALVERYHQPALVERFLPGREFTVGLLGSGRPRVLPPMEIVFEGQASPLPIYSFAHKTGAEGGVRYEVPARIDDGLRQSLERTARRAYTALGCRDVGRIDLRLDGDGRVNFIECNPLPGLTPGWSDLCLIAEAAGMSYEQLIGAILAPALRRARLGGRRGLNRQPVGGEVRR